MSSFTCCDIRGCQWKNWKKHPKLSTHRFPSEVCLRTAWLRALGKQDSHLPDSAVVCSQHFLNDDIYETESGLMQIRTGAIPSTVQVCMICLDTDSKLFLMSKHKLEEAYEQLTGHALCDQGNLKQTVCVQCAQRLINCSQFKDKCLRARALMMDLVEKHKLITRQHVKMINRTTNKLTNNIVMITLGADPCDLYILEQPSEDKQTDSEATIHRDMVKKEESYNSIFIDENMEVANEDVNDADYIKDEFVADNKEFEYETHNPLKYESSPFQCTVCFEEFVYENAYMQHMSMHMQNGAGDGECAASQECEPHTAVSSDASLLTESRQRALRQCPDACPSTGSAQADVVPLSARHATRDDNKARAERAGTLRRSPLVITINNGQIVNPSYINGTTNIDKLTNCVVKSHDVFQISEKCSPVKGESLAKTSTPVSSCDTQCIQTVSEDLNFQAASGIEDIEPITSKANVNNSSLSETLQSASNCPNNDNDESSLFIEKDFFTCGVCAKMYAQKSLLDEHMKSHTVRLFTCELCEYKTRFKNSYVVHVRRHTGEKPFHCDLCEYKSGDKSHLLRHMKTHTGEKPYTCEVCEYKFSDKSNLVCHMRSHNGEKRGKKRYSCELCEYKCSQKCQLVYHMRTHTGETSCGHTGHLLIPTTINIDEKPYACELCEYRCSRKNHLACHMRTHTPENL